MRKTKKRFLSALLACAMLISLFPFAAFADGNVAKIGNQSYPTLQAAITAASDGAEIVLIANANENVTVAADDNITLDLNGFTLDGGTKAKSPALTNNGTIIIKDSSEDQTGTIKRSDNGPTGTYYTISNEGTMTIQSGNVCNNAGSPTTWSGSSLICNGLSSDKAKLTINGGNIQQDYFIAVKNDENGTLEVNGGVIKSNTQAVQNWKKATISGGELTGTVSTWAYSKYAGNTEIKGDVVIDGDVTACWFNAKAGGNAVQEGVMPNVDIKGGTISGTLLKASTSSTNGPATVEIADSKYADINVSGGQFTSPVNAAFLADGYKIELNSVANTEAPYSYYKTISDAIAAAQPGDEIKNVAAATGNTYNVVVKYNNGASDLTYTVTENEVITLPAAPIREGYTFKGWVANGERYGAGKEVTITENTTFTADWEAPYTGKYSYEITVAKTDNGTVSVDKYATEGEDVTITITPDKGYKLDELTVTAGSKDVDVKDNGNGTYTFTMPSSKVKVAATFVEDENYDDSITISMTVGSNDFVINDTIVTIPDAAPYIANSRTYVPFRALGEAIGADVVWDNDARTVTYTLDGNEIVMTIGSTTYTVNGVEKTMDVAPEITGERTYVPIRFIGEALGFKVTPLYAEDGTTASVVFEK